jgi:hypothetical protein
MKNLTVGVKTTTQKDFFAQQNLKFSRSKAQNYQEKVSITYRCSCTLVETCFDHSLNQLHHIIIGSLFEQKERKKERNDQDVVSRPNLIHSDTFLGPKHNK